MVRFKRTSSERRSPPIRLSSRKYAHISPPSRRVPRHRGRANLKKHTDIRNDREEELEDMYRLLLRSPHHTEEEEEEEDEDAGPDRADIQDSSDEEEEWDEDATLNEILGSPEYSEEKLLQMLSRAFADASQGLREDVVLSLRPLLSSIRNARATPGRPFITGLLGFDDVCKRFEKSSSAWNVELEGAYAKIEVETRQLFERLQTAYSRIDERYIAFEAQMKEQTNKMREIISTLPADVDALTTRLERRFMDIGKDDGSMTKKERRERTVQGALADLQL